MACRARQPQIEQFNEHGDDWQLRSINNKHDQRAPQGSAANLPRDRLLMFYREIGIPAVAAALEASSCKPQKTKPKRKDIPAVLRNDKAA
jgi:hypothetical protein